MDSIILLILFGGIIWFWVSTLQCREITKVVAQKTCKQFQLQLLDDTITITKLRVKRNENGRLSWQRTYQFEFSDSGNNRQKGTIVMFGTKVEILEMPDYMNRIISPV
ncbi:MAG: DUF3301 domain-containing protein [Candidatus Marithrix sp.]|nr:DUF3301 domain-containing protein [Candidatus Marithrix sp.]